MPRVALAIFVLGLAGCGGLSANSSRSLGEVAANGTFYGAVAAAQAIPAPVETRPAPAAVPPHSDAPSRHYVCVAYGEEHRVRARSRSGAESTCAEACSCVEALIAEELRFYE